MRMASGTRMKDWADANDYDAGELINEIGARNTIGRPTDAQVNAIADAYEISPSDLRDFITVEGFLSAQRRMIAREQGKIGEMIRNAKPKQYTVRRGSKTISINRDAKGRFASSGKRSEFKRLSYKARIRHGMKGLER